MKEKFLIANITWNPSGWRNTYVNPRAGHSYAREYPGHESLNFKFDKKKIDTNKYIYGYVQWSSKPKYFEDGGLILFFSRNTETRKGLIVGIYSNAEILEENLEKVWRGFKDGIISLNIRADKNLSMLFPIHLDADKYKDNKSKRLVGQIGYSYYTINKAKQIIKDELIALSSSGIHQNEFLKLREIYKNIADEEINLEMPNNDELEQQELVAIYNNKKSKIINELANLKITPDEMVVVRNKTYKRVNKVIAQLKILRDFECQICHKTIKKKNGDFYIEAAHITPKHKRGKEIPENILILCPNHHKEFDFGKRVIKTHNKDFIMFYLNDVKYKIDLSIK